MKRILLTFSVLVALAVPAGATAGGTSTPSAQVDSMAVVVMHVVTNATTNFTFSVFDCPAGAIINIVWTAEQPTPGTTTEGEGTFVSSTGDPVQHFVVSTVGGFRPGFAWNGMGVVSCGAVTIPISGQGQTKSAHGM
jgi:hypothetical protein